MENIKNELSVYRERVCKIDNINLEIENIIVNGANNKDERIKELRFKKSDLELKTQQIYNIVQSLEEKERTVINFVFLEGKEKKKLARELDRSVRQIDYTIYKALRIMENIRNV